MKSSHIGVVAFLALILTNSQSVLANKPIDLNISQSTKQVFRVKSRLEGRGNVTPRNGQVMKLNLDARFQYDERTIARAKMLKSIRHYHQARAEIRLGPGSIINTLRDKQRMILSQTSARSFDDAVQIASITGPLTQNEYELIDTPADTLIAAHLFNKKKIEIGDQWKPNNSILARFLNIDTVQENNVNHKLLKIEKSIATIHTSGELVGYIDGAKTDINVSGTTHFDVKLGQIRQLIFTINQNREIGLLAPGLQAVFKIQTEIQPIDSTNDLTDSALAKLQSQRLQITDHLVLVSKSNLFSLTHPRAWRLISDTQDRTVLRYLHQGEMLGQCDILPLPKRPAEHPQTLENFKKSIRDNLADQQAAIINAHQSTTASGLEWLRVEAAGASDGVALHWIYYVLNHADGRRLQLVFTTEPQQKSAFTGADQSLINAIEFGKSSTPVTSNAKYGN